MAEEDFLRHRRLDFEFQIFWVTDNRNDGLRCASEDVRTLANIIYRTGRTYGFNEARTNREITTATLHTDNIV